MNDKSEFIISGDEKNLMLVKYTGTKDHVEIPNGITRICREAFCGCANVKTIDIPSSVKLICNKAFCNMPNLEVVTFGEGLETIEHEAFANCVNLKYVRLPESLKDMEYATFCKCERLEKIEFGKKLKVLEANVLYRCNGITELVIPKTIKKVSTNEINGLDGLKLLRIESDFSKVKKFHIVDCKNLTDVTFIEEIVNLKGLQFIVCPKLEKVTVAGKSYKVITNGGIGILELPENTPENRVNNDPIEIRFNEKYERYESEYKDILFTSDHKFGADECNLIRTLAENYYLHLNELIKFMLPDIKALYGKVSVKSVKEKLGRPVIDIDDWTVTYTEQSFDDVHIFKFELMDEEFEDIDLFSIDG